VTLREVLLGDIMGGIVRWH